MEYLSSISLKNHKKGPTSRAIDAGEEEEGSPNLERNNLVGIGSLSDKQLLKKAKLFLDERQRLKNRLLSLINFIQVAHELDQALFFREHADQIWLVLSGQFQVQVDKITARSERPNSFSGKEMMMLLRVLSLLRKTLMYLGEKLRTGWCNAEIAHMLRMLLDHRNHPRFRQVGFRLLLMWLSATVPDKTPQMTYLYDNTINLSLLAQDSISRSDRKIDVPVVLGQEMISSEMIPLYPDNTERSSQSELKLLRIAFQNIVRLAHLAAGTQSPPPDPDDDLTKLDESGEDLNDLPLGMGLASAREAAHFMLTCMKNSYLSKLLPRACYGEVVEENRGVSRIEFWGDPGMGLANCPPPILRLLLSFYIKYCAEPINQQLEEQEGSAKRSSIVEMENYMDEGASTAVRAVLKTIFFENEDMRALYREVLRQALTLKPINDYVEIVRAAVYLYGAMVTGQEENRPPFMRNGEVEEGEFPTYLHQSHEKWNRYLRESLNLLTLVFEPRRKSTSYSKGQRLVYNDVFVFIRFLTTQHADSLELATWKAIMELLMGIQAVVLVGAPITFGSKSSDVVIEKLIETTFMTWIRAPQEVDPDWTLLRETYSKLTKWPHLIRQWIRFAQLSTDIATTHAFNPSAQVTPLINKSAFSNPSSPVLPKADEEKPVSKITRRPRNLSEGGGLNFEPTNKQADDGAKSPNWSERIASSYAKVRRASISGDDIIPRKIGIDEDPRSRNNVAVVGEDDYLIPDLSRFSPFFIYKKVKLTGSRHSVINDFSIFAQFDLDYTFLERLEDWTPESALANWNSAVCCLGNPNSIEDPHFHRAIITSLVEIWEHLYMVDDLIPRTQPIRPNLSLFVAWMMQAADLTYQYGDSRVIAFSCLCRMICQKQLNLPREFYFHFYRLLLKGVALKDNAVRYTILRNAKRLFQSSLPGSSFLIPGFIMCVRTVLFSEDQTSMNKINEKLRKDVIMLLCSMLSIPNNMKEEWLPLVTYNKLLNRDAAIEKLPDEITSNDIKLHLKEILLTLAAVTTRQPLSELPVDSHVLLIHGLAMLALEEHSHDKGDEKIVRQCFDRLLEKLYLSDLQITLAATSFLECFEQSSKPLPEAIISDIIENLLASININMASHSIPGGEHRVPILVELFTTLTRWITRIPSHLFRERLIKPIFDAVQLTFNIIPETIDKVIEKNSPKMKANEAIDYSIVKEAAEVLLFHLLNILGTFPSPHGPDLLQSFVNESEKDPGVEFFVRTNTLVSVSEHQNMVRLILRNPTGRWCWDFSSTLYDSFEKEKEDESPASMLTTIKLPTMVKNTEVPPESPGLDPLKRLLRSFEKSEEFGFRESNDDNLDEKSELELQRLMEKHLELECSIQAQQQENVNTDGTGRKEVEKHDAMSKCRTLLTQLGLLDYSMITNRTISLINPTKSYFRDLRELDRKYCREIVKVALIYVAPNQNTESAILSNEKGSQGYYSFVESLGWTVDLATHCGYRAKLEFDGTNGEFANYYSTESLELMFHDITRMPNDPSDEKRVKKKRHVGNDQVHVVWSENPSFYQANTIKGDFGNVQIIIYPRENGLYSVDIYHDSNLSGFGPLCNGALVSAAALPTLVRVTAIRAYRACLRSYSTLAHMYTLRARDLQFIHQRHTSSDGYHFL